MKAATVDVDKVGSGAVANFDHLNKLIVTVTVTVTVTVIVTVTTRWQTVTVPVPRPSPDGAKT